MIKLIICEKPSVAREIAGYLGSNKIDPKLKCYKTDEYYIANSVGHLIHLDPPKMGFNKKPSENIIIPTELAFTPISEDRIELINNLSSLINSPEVDEIINCCDSDRAGELIFWNIYNYSGSTKPVKRFWTSEFLSKNLVLKLLSSGLIDSDKYYPYKESELVREYSDLVLGYNCSTLYAIKKNQFGLSLGRCQSPVLCEIVNRYNQNKSHKKITSYYVEVVVDGIKARSTESFNSKPETVEFIDGSLKIESIERSVDKKSAPELYSKESLLSESSKIGLTAEDITAVLQETYEKLKITSYPRTGSSFMDEKKDTIDKVFNVIENLGYKFDKSTLMKRGKAVFNNSKVEGHYALIILDGRKAENHITDFPNSKVSKVLKLIKERMLTRCSPPVIYDSIKINFSGDFLIDGKKTHLSFSIDGRNTINPGWTDYDFIDKSKYNYNIKLFDYTENSELTISESSLAESTTKPKPLYTSGSIIKWMKSVNIGTPATIDSFSKILIKKGYIQRLKGDKLVPTDLGLSIYADIKEKLIGTPDLTGKIEGFISNIISNNDLSGFDNTKLVVDTMINKIYNDLKLITKPKMESIKKSIPSSILGVKLTDHQRRMLDKGDVVFVKNMTSKRTGKKFNAYVLIRDEKLVFKF